MGMVLGMQKETYQRRNLLIYFTSILTWYGFVICDYDVMCSNSFFSIFSKAIYQPPRSYLQCDAYSSVSFDLVAKIVLLLHFPPPHTSVPMLAKSSVSAFTVP